MSFGTCLQILTSFRVDLIWFGASCRSWKFISSLSSIWGVIHSFDVVLYEASGRSVLYYGTCWYIRTGYRVARVNFGRGSDRLDHFWLRLVGRVLVCPHLRRGWSQMQARRCDTLVAEAKHAECGKLAEAEFWAHLHVRRSGILDHRSEGQRRSMIFVHTCICTKEDLFPQVWRVASGDYPQKRNFCRKSDAAEAANVSQVQTSLGRSIYFGGLRIYSFLEL